MAKDALMPQGATAKRYRAVRDSQAHATHRSRSPVSAAACSNKSVSSREAIPAILASMTGRASRELDRVTVRVTCGGDAGAGTTGSRESQTRRDSQRDACSRPDTVSASSHDPDSRSGTHAPVASPSAIKGYSQISTWGRL